MIDNQYGKKLWPAQVLVEGKRNMAWVEGEWSHEHQLQQCDQIQKEEHYIYEYFFPIWYTYVYINQIFLFSSSLPLQYHLKCNI